MFDPSKPVTTRDGRKARIICTDAKNIKPIIALVEIDAGIETCMTYATDGRFWRNGMEEYNDLINITEEGE